MISAIIGLGNIGKKYEGTRHNLGFELLNLVAGKWGLKASPTDGDYYQAEKEWEGHQIRLIWPTTYMNNSGLAVSQVLEKYQLSPNDLLICYDDFNISLGTIRIRTGGSNGGHNGMESIIYNLGTEEVPRLRMGVGPIPAGIDPISFVLNRFYSNESEIVNKMLVNAGEAVLYSINNSAAKAMSLYNRSAELSANDNPAPDDTQNSGAV
jgi:peptidyl-tRNA hydrolase, PTH1 family